MNDVRVIELVEFQPQYVAREEIGTDVGEQIWREFGKQVQVEFPSPKTGDRWLLTNVGWTGYLPIKSDLGILLTPKVPLANIFRMMAYAYGVDDIRFFDHLIRSESIGEAYEQLAVVLARRVSARTRRGLYRTYQQRRKHLPFVRGRIEIEKALREPWRVDVPCQFRIHTADVEDNFILVWALERILRSGICRGDALLTVRQAYKLLQARVNTPPFAGQKVSNRSYSRLNADYEHLHALCRFFLENSGPTHHLGDRQMIPFVVDMARLFEKFAATWLNEHLPSDLVQVEQESIRLGNAGQVSFRIDPVVRDRDSGQTMCVIDTKYKRSSHIASDDVAQVIAYAGVEAAGLAVLLYPEQVATPFDAMTKHVRIRTLGFPLHGNLEEEGVTMLH